MMPIKFPGSSWIGKPPSMTDEQCTGIPGARIHSKEPVVVFGIEAQGPNEDNNGHEFYLTKWQPSKEDLDALNNGEGIYIKTVANGLPPMLLFTVDQEGNLNL